MANQMTEDRDYLLKAAANLSKVMNSPFTASDWSVKPSRKGGGMWNGMATGSSSLSNVDDKAVEPSDRQS